MKFDVVVVGGGHAGAEAAHAAAKLGSKTALISMDLNKISLMPCNPSIGGVGKGHIVYEISALGGLMPKLCSKTYLQARMLNTKKGPAVQGLRLQIDKHTYSKSSKAALEQTPNLTLVAGKVTDLIVENNQITGITLADGTNISCKAVILTTGTFLNGLMHVGHKNFAGGRRDEEAAITLSDSLKKLDLQLDRLKTGTPPRILRTSVDFSKLEIQESHDLEYLYEFYPQAVEHKLPCYIAYTNPNTHKTILDNAEKSPIFTGDIKGKPPRYCPSIEDKVKRFSHKDSHHVFIEPEDATYEEVYPSGLSTAMPLEVQEKFIRSMQGFENAIITKAGYAVEYDYVEPNQLKHSLETKKVAGLFLAGQINGTTGYEEAAGQGIMAGINASQKAQSKPAFILQREESYIGLMIDDLVTLGVKEPYRMFTSRAERRIVLRQDNVFMRLSPKAHALGMLDDAIYNDIKFENNLVIKILTKLKELAGSGHLLKVFGLNECDFDAIKAYVLKLGTELNFGEKDLSHRALQIIYAEVKYEEYLKREQKEIEKAQKYRDLVIPANVDFTDTPGLSKEIQEKLAHHKPETIAQALLIPGMTPAAISLLIFRCRTN
jgi:tRNA uridine 5-carboxymethylaminomethyl modification enzyme